MTTSVHCPHCGAPFREADARFCSFYGTERPKPERPPAPLAPNAPERFEAAERHPSVAELLRRSPSTVGHAMNGACGIGFLLLFCVVAIVIASAFLGMGGLDHGGIGTLFTLLPLALVGFGLVALISVVARTAKFQSAELVRAIALVVDERVAVSGGKHASTTYYASLETKDRTRREYQIDSKLAGKIAPGDFGMAYTKGDVLLDFERIGA